jgi:hypothetical protein
VTAFLRYLGVLNAALWLGAAVFLIIGLPALFSDELKNYLVPPKGPTIIGLAAQLVLARFFILQYCCGAVGLAHLALEWLYCGKPLLQRNLAILAVLIGLSLAGGLWMQPKLKNLHQQMYSAATKPAQDEAKLAFKAWHGASECGNLVMIGGLLIYLWRLSRPAGQARFGNLNLDKIRG